MAIGVCLPSTSSSPAVEARRRAPSTSARGGVTIKCGCVGGKGTGTRPAGGLSEKHYRTLRLTPGATKGEVKKAFRNLALQYHPDVCKQSSNDDGGHDFQRISVAYQMVMSSMREAEERLEYWRLRYDLADEDLDRYRSYLNDDDDDWFDI